MKKLYSNKEELQADIQEENPRLIFLTGKTSSGKTFFSNKLELLGYQIIALDRIVYESVMGAFKITDAFAAFATYRGSVPREWIEAFIQDTRNTIMAKLQAGPVVVEGALANNEMIKAVFSGQLENFLFVFLQPVDVLIYAGRVLERFQAGIEFGTTRLPKEFFQMVDQVEIKNYLNTKQINKFLEKKVQEFAKWSLEESRRRLEYFQTGFDDISIVSI